MKRPQPIGILGAMASEVALLKESMQVIQGTEAAGTMFLEGQLAGVPIVLAQCGIGKVRAAMCAQAMIDHYNVKWLINTGVAGGLHPQLRIGDIVLATYAVEHDFDLTTWGYARGHHPADDAARDKVTAYAASKRLNIRLKEAAMAAEFPGKLVEGIIASGDVFVADRALKRRLLAEFGAAAVEMEGGAIAHVAAANGVPFAIVRAVSDLADGTAVESFDSFEAEAAAHSAAMLIQMARELD